MNKLFKNGLLITHNLKEENFLFAQQIGGLAMPSLAIINPEENVLNKFGEITLVGKENLLSPSVTNKSKVYINDIYSARMPPVEYIHKENSIDLYVDTIKEIKEKYNIKNDKLFLLGLDKYNRLIKLNNLDYEFIVDNTHLAELFLLKNNIKLEKLYEKSKQENENIQRLVNNKINNLKLRNEFGVFVFEFKNILLNKEPCDFELIFDYNCCYNYDNKDLYKPYTIENCFELMKLQTKYGIKNTEHSVVNYKNVLLGELKAYLSEEISSNELIIKNKDKIKNYLVVDNIENKFLDFIENKSFEILMFNGKKINIIHGIYALNSENKQDINDFIKENKILPRDESMLIKILEDCQEKLMSIPTGYFELKYTDILNFSSFSHALIPNNLKDKDSVLNILNKYNIDIVEYDYKEQEKQQKYNEEIKFEELNDFKLKTIIQEKLININNDILSKKHDFHTNTNGFKI